MKIKKSQQEAVSLFETFAGQLAAVFKRRAVEQVLLHQPVDDAAEEQSSDIVASEAAPKRKRKRGGGGRKPFPPEIPRHDVHVAGHTAPFRICRMCRRM